MAESKKPAAAPPPRWRKRLVIGLLLIVGASIAGRAMLVKERERGAAARQEAAKERSTNPLTPVGIMPQTTPEDGETPPEEKAEPGTAEKILPFLTEGGIAMLLGLALGIATRSIFKIALILIAVTFVAIQFLAYKGLIADVDWGGIASGAKDLVLNLPDTTGLSEMLQYKLPSAGSLVLGYYLGLKRG